jgi:hypothetical protein
VPAIDSAVKMKERIWMRRIPEMWERHNNRGKRDKGVVDG